MRQFNWGLEKIVCFLLYKEELHFAQNIIC